MQPDWKALAEPFPAEEVKQRPGAATWDHKPSCEGPRCKLTRDPKMHHQFDYVDARAVAQRLDDVLTPAGWQFTCHVLGGDVVAGHLVIRNGDEWIAREDHGYPNSDRDEEPIKAATSDALKRCAVLFGIGRHLYGDNTPKRPAARTTNGAAVPPQVAAAPAPSAAGRGSPSPRPAASTVPPEPDWMDGPRQPVGGIEPGAEDGTCPQHGKPWRENAKGFYCGTPVAKGPDGSVTKWCDEKPTQRWVTSRGLVSAR